MLIMTRKPGEVIRLSAHLEIEIRAIEGNEVVIAVHADRQALFSSTPPHRFHGSKEGRLFRAANAPKL